MGIARIFVHEPVFIDFKAQHVLFVVLRILSRILSCSQIQIKIDYLRIFLNGKFFIECISSIFNPSNIITFLSLIHLKHNIAIHYVLCIPNVFKIAKFANKRVIVKRPPNLNQLYYGDMLIQERHYPYRALFELKIQPTARSISTAFRQYAASFKNPYKKTRKRKLICEYNQ